MCENLTTATRRTTPMLSEIADVCHSVPGQLRPEPDHFSSSVSQGRSAVSRGPSMATVLHASTTRHRELWDGPGRYIRIVLHDTTEQLRRAARRYRGSEHDDWSETGACFHPAPDVERYEAGVWSRVTPRGWAGVMRLSREYLEVEVVVHESVHAALAIYRMDVDTDVQLGDGCAANEETLAYIVGDLTTEVLAALHGCGAWT